MPTNLNSEKYEKFFKGLFVGPTGRGKTIAASSWPGKTLIIDIDGRHKPIIGWYPDRVKEGDFAVESVGPDNFWNLKPLVNGLGNYNPYQNIIVDGITTLSTTTVIMQLKKKGSWGDWAGNKDTEDAKGNNINAGGVMVPGWPEFNGAATIITTLIETLKSLKCNIFFTAHPVERIAIAGKNKPAIKYQSIVAYGPKVESLVPSYFDEVWYFDYTVETDNIGREKIKRVVYTSPCEDYLEAKTALKIPSSIDYTDKNLFDCVKEYL